MKKTFNINLGGFVFYIDEDAFARLEQYQISLKNKFSNEEEQDEIIQDIEYRMAEIFKEKLKASKIESISLDMVKEAIGQLGEADEIDDSSEEQQNTSQKQNYKRKLFRDPNDKILGGVISGFCHFIGFDHPVLMRLAYFFLTIASIGFPGIIIYIILYLIVPEAKTTTDKLQMKGEMPTLENIENAVKRGFDKVVGNDKK